MKTNSLDAFMTDYQGRLLHTSCSDELHTRVRTLIDSLLRIEALDPPVIPYLAAWDEDRQVIWYEFVGRRFCELLGCDLSTAADAFRTAVLDRRIYRYCNQNSAGVEEEIITRAELGGQRYGLREEVKRAGTVEAVYKILVDDSIMWIKDQAKIENFNGDNVCLSVGFLTDVTKEMEQKDFFEKIGYFDELTGLPKRLILERIFEVNIGNLNRFHIDDFVFMMIDIDYFKAVNDTYGHQAGDYVLAALAELMVSSKRKEDEIGRYGGEEFYCFSIGSVENGVDFAERLRENIEKHMFIHNGETISITVSIGVAAASQFAGVKEFGSDFLVNAADKMLYAAKKNGRNQVVLYRGANNSC